jgi:hypothetical protein
MLRACLKIRCDGESEKFYKIFGELNMTKLNFIRPNFGIDSLRFGSDFGRFVVAPFLFVLCVLCSSVA